MGRCCKSRVRLYVAVELREIKALRSTLRLETPLVYQSTTSLGLGQVQMPRPKEVVATGAAARGSKKWYNFFAEIKSSSPVKYEYIHPLWNYLRIQSLKFGTSLVSARWILE